MVNCKKRIKDSKDDILSHLNTYHEVNTGLKCAVTARFFWTVLSVWIVFTVQYLFV